MLCVGVDPPEIVERPKDVAVRSGGIAAFYCRARGEPTPQLSWRKNGRKVRNVLFFFVKIGSSWQVTKRFSAFSWVGRHRFRLWWPNLPYCSAFLPLGTQWHYELVAASGMGNVSVGVAMVPGSHLRGGWPLPHVIIENQLTKSLCWIILMRQYLPISFHPPRP